MVDLQAAYATCERVASAHYENFPVASLLLPRDMRPHVAAVYAFARAADDFADEGTRPPGERLRLLQRWRDRLHGRHLDPDAGEPAHTADLFLALAATIRARSLPLALFEDLLSAFSQDVTVSRYETWDDLLDYCRRSANPVGRLVLRIAGAHDAALDAHSDAICTALQLTNFWQDVKIDFDRGRIYLPRQELREQGAEERDFASRPLSDPLRRALAAAVARTRDLFERGRPLCDAVRGRLRHELRATWLGGMRILDRLERVHFDPVASRPRLTAGDVPWLAWHLVAWRTR